MTLAQRSIAPLHDATPIDDTSCLVACRTAIGPVYHCGLSGRYRSRGFRPWLNWPCPTAALALPRRLAWCHCKATPPASVSTPAEPRTFVSGITPNSRNPNGAFGNRVIRRVPICASGIKNVRPGRRVSAISPASCLNAHPLVPSLGAAGLAQCQENLSQCRPGPQSARLSCARLGFSLTGSFPVLCIMFDVLFKGVNSIQLH